MRGSRGEGDKGFAPPPGKSQVLWVPIISIWTPYPPGKSLTPPGKGWALLENIGHPSPPPKPCKIIVFFEKKPH